MDANTRAISIFTAYLLINFSLTGLITRDIWTGLHAASKIEASDTKSVPSTRGGSKIPGSHATLALICLGVTWYYMISFFSLSYQSWAHDNHINLPRDIYEILEDPSIIQLGRWLKDVQLFRDAWEVVVETSGRWCWSQPIFFITAGWSFFIAFHGHSKNIPHIWAYMVLGQLVAISFAMNLFFIAVWTYGLAKSNTDGYGNSTAQLSPKTRSLDSDGLWLPPTKVYSTITTVTIASVLAVPGATGTSYFLQTLAISHVLLLLPPILCKSTPTILRVKCDKKTYDEAYWWQLSMIFLAFGTIQSYTYWQAVQDKTPNSHLHRHSNVYVRPQIVKQNQLPSLIAPLLDHPAVSSVGWDSILCIVSATVWVIRA